jgi:hypothetical protein
MGLSLSLLSTCLAISCHMWGGVLKCSTSLTFPLPVHFISHGVISSLNAFFESVNGLMNFLQGIKASPLRLLDLYL